MWRHLRNAAKRSIQQEKGIQAYGLLSGNRQEQGANQEQEQDLVSLGPRVRSQRALAC